MMNTLFTSKGMRQGSHHLYEDLALPISAEIKPDEQLPKDELRDEDFEWLPLKMNSVNNT